jgi:ribose transport system permease protein
MRSNKAGKLVTFIIEQNTVFIFIILIIISSLVSEVFFTSVNLSNLARQVSGIGVVSMGMLLVILTGGIDLSVGSVLALCGVLCAIFSNAMPLFMAVILTLFCGMTVGSISGYLISIQKMAPFVATLALMTIARGLAFIFSKGAPILVSDNASALIDFGSGKLFGMPNPVLVFIFVTIAVFILLNYNVFGRIAIAVGSNEEAVRLSGVKIWVYKFSVYIIAGGLAAIAGIIGTSRTGVGSPIVGSGMELDAIAAVVIGGASLKGGKGTAWNTFLGILILGMIGNIMNLLDIPAYPQQVVKGLIIIFAVLLQRFQSNQR